MCKILNIPTSTYYYTIKNRVKTKSEKECKLADFIEQIFYENRKVYGARKIKAELEKHGYIISRRRIGRILKERGLCSVYTKARYRVIKSHVNQSLTENVVNREFDDRNKHQVIVSDLTYARVQNQWYYVCLFSDLFNREIIGYSAGPNKDTQLVFQALARIQTDINNIEYIHTDRGREFDNKMIDEFMDTFGIKRSLSRKGNPYDNAVAETTFKAFKIEFVYQTKFYSLEQLQIELELYVDWYNNQRLHGSLGYMTPTEYRLINSV